MSDCSLDATTSEPIGLAFDFKKDHHISWIFPIIKGWLEENSLNLAYLYNYIEVFNIYRALLVYLLSVKL